MPDHLNELDATELAARIRRQEITAEAIARACLEQINSREATVGAWAHLNPQQVIDAARALDQGPVRGLLHGIPIGVKDVFETIDFPTECGTAIYAGRRTSSDAACVAATKAQGAVVLGKTVTAELAYLDPGKTRNPRNLAHTPGGSSSGSAAAVADLMVPLAFGTQTAGSIIRPAAFCGVVGYKPSFNLVSRAGLKLSADSLDTIGFFARTVSDAALFAAAVSGRPTLAEIQASSPTRIGICHTYEWLNAAPETIKLLDEVEQKLTASGVDVETISLPETFSDISSAQQIIMGYEMTRSLAFEWHAHRERLSQPLTTQLSDGLAIPPVRYDAARRKAKDCRAWFTDVFRRVDVLITPSAIGEAPPTLANTGNPAFNRLWTLMGTPAITVPAGAGPQGLPLGIQIVGPINNDMRALSAAAWVHDKLLV